MTVDEILADFPDLEAEDIQEALHFAAEALLERTLPHSPRPREVPGRPEPVAPTGEILVDAGHDAVHVRSPGLATAPTSGHSSQPGIDASPR